VPARFRQLSEGATLPLAAFETDTESLWCKSVGATVQVGKPNGAGQKDGWRRSDFALLTCARNRHPKRFSGAGPYRKN